MILPGPKTNSSIGSRLAGPRRPARTRASVRAARNNPTCKSISSSVLCHHAVQVSWPPAVAAPGTRQSSNSPRRVRRLSRPAFGWLPFLSFRSGAAPAPRRAVSARSLAPHDNCPQYGSSPRAPRARRAIRQAGWGHRRSRHPHLRRVAIGKRTAERERERARQWTEAPGGRATTRCWAWRATRPPPTSAPPTAGWPCNATPTSCSCRGTTHEPRRKPGRGSIGSRRLTRDLKPTMEEVDAILTEIKVCSPSSWSSRSDVGTSATGSQAAARSASGKQSAAASSRRYSPFSHK
ncbi:hypothetical protein C2845_PM09G21380 [Panicum miliaceum]|uniref:Uncharacterized protein n=1 Tax=Panicum miliaceum TaxID=4540 RepID=A0A3L6RYQ6_PANMI|nr:hypothetical protein C2845_PM09G21380 [Panicum miliaceum]